jgi:hypothetical protein
MREHGDDQQPHDDDDARAPWATAETMTVLLLAAAGCAAIAGLAAAWDGWNREVTTSFDPNDPSAFVSQTPEALTRLADAALGFGQAAGALLLLGFIALFLLWRHLDDLEAAGDGDGDFPLDEGEVARAGRWLRGTLAVFGLTVVAALGAAFGWLQQISDSAGPGIGAVSGWSALLPQLGTAFAAVAGLVGVASLLRDQRDLVVTEISATTD